MARVRQLLFTRIFLALMVTSAGMQEAMSGSFFRKDDFKDAQPVVLSQAEMDAVSLGEWPKLLDTTVSSTHTDGRWQGMTWHYLGRSSRETGEVERFDIFIVDDDDSELDNLPDTHFRNPVPYGNNVSALDVGYNLAGWTCSYVFGCVKTCLYSGAGISLSQITAATNAVKTRLTADNGKQALKLLGGQVVNFSVGIAAGLAGFYITNTLQKDTSGQDTCAATSARLDRIELLLEQVAQNVNDIGHRIREADCRSRVYDHYSDDPKRQVEGRHFRQAVKVQKESSPTYSDPKCRS